MSMSRCLWIIVTVLLLPLSVLLGESFESSTLYLTWQRDPCSTMTMQWLSKNSDSSESEIRYRNEAGGHWYFSKGKIVPLPGSSYFVYQVELEGLQPDSTYQFKIASEEDLYRFKTMPTDTQHGISFVVGGDMYHDDISFMINTSKQAAKVNPQFAVIGGDIAYVYVNRMITKFHKWIEWIQAWHSHMVTPEGVLIPVIAAIGNHDVAGGYDQTPLVAKDFATLFPMPGDKIFNVLDFQQYLSLFLLDSGHANSVGGAQAEWLNKALWQRSKIPHKFAFYHVPAYPGVRSFRNNYSAAIRKYWVPLFENGGIDIAFEHHDHAYKRTYSILKNKVHPRGVVYIGDGGWGVEKPRIASVNKRPFYLAKTLSVRHFLLVDIHGDNTSVKCIDDQGKVLDGLALNRNDEL